MIDFIISKIGILLFAVTMAGLLLYFSGSLKDVFLSDETIQISNVIAKQIKYMAESDNLCASTRVILPRYIDIFGVSNSATYSSIYYFMDIQVVKSQTTDDRFVVFTIYNKQTKKQIALESFRTKSEVQLYDFKTKEQTDKITIDPTLNSVVYMVKGKTPDSLDSKKSITTLYFVNCKYNSDSLINKLDPFDDCYIQLQEVKQKTKEITSVNGEPFPFFCVPLAQDMSAYLGTT